MAPVELEVVVHKPTADTKCVRWPCPIATPVPRCDLLLSGFPYAQGFVLDSDYEGDNGHPRIRDVEPSSIANDLLFKGDILMAINGTAIAHHNQAAKVLKGCKGDMVLTVLAKKPRSTSFFGKKSKSSLVPYPLLHSLASSPCPVDLRPSHLIGPTAHPQASSFEVVSAVKAAAAEQTAAEVAAAAKAAADKAAAIAADAATKVQNVGDGVKDFFNGAAAKVQGISPGRKSKSDVAKDENEGLETVQLHAAPPSLSGPPPPPHAPAPACQANEAGEQKAVNGEHQRPSCP